MMFKSVQALLAASILLMAVGCQGSSLFMPEPVPTPSPTATRAPTHTPAPTPTITLSPVPRQLILGVTPSPDGQRLAVVDDIGLRVYDMTSYGEMWRAPVPGMSDDLRLNQVQIAWTADSTALSVSIGLEYYDGTNRFLSTVSRFDAASGRLLWQQSFEDRPNVTFAPDGNHFMLMSLVFDTAELWDGLAPERTGTLELPQYASLERRIAKWSPNGSLIAGKIKPGSPTQVVEFIEGVMSVIGGTNAREPGIFVWDAVTGRLVTTLRDWRQGISWWNDLEWSPDGSNLISKEGGRFILWGTETWVYQSQIVYTTPFNSATIELSPDDTKLASLLFYNPFKEAEDIRFAIHAWAMPSGKPLPPAGGALIETSGEAWFDFAGWMPDGNAFVCQIGERMVTFDASRGQVGGSFAIPQIDRSAWGATYNIYLDYYQLSPDGNHVYLVQPQAVVVYDAQSGEVVVELAD